MHKNWFVYVVVLILTGVLSAASCFISVSAFICVTAAYMTGVIWWTIYYYRLKYTAIDNTICITSGVFFVRKRFIATGNILWTTRVRVPCFNKVIISKLHTSGGCIVIFGDFSTEC